MAPGAITTGTAVNGAGPYQSAEDALTAATARFAARNPRSAELHAQALGSMPGGNTRAQLYTFPFPVCMKSGQGYQVTSEDGHV